MHSVGIRLREAREKTGLSLNEINARTRINANNLVAIEHDDVSNISSPFFYRSFVRQYAEQVGLDFQMLEQGVNALAVQMPQPALPGQGKDQPARVIAVQLRPNRDFTWMKPAAVFLLAIAFGSGGFAAFKYFGPLIHEAAVLPEVSSNPAYKQIATQPVAEEKPVPDKIHLTLSAIERTWFSVSADGKPVYSGILEPKETKVLDGHESAKLRTGNAGGVNINFNGKDIGVIGPRGTSRTVVFTKTGYAVQPPARSSLIRADHIGG